MTKKNIIRVEHATKTHMVGDGFKVSQLMPGYGRNMTPETSPFLMLDYNAPWEIAPQKSYRGGVGYHPHRGFETVSISYSGEVEHHDTKGNHGIIRAGEVQWMTAGSGLLHQEYQGEDFMKKGGIQHFVQLWVDLPKEHKMTEPRYQALTMENIPEVSFTSGKVRVMAGEYDGVKWAAKTFSPIELWDVRFDKMGDFVVNVADGHNLMILIAEGEVEIDGKNFEAGSLVYFSLKWENVGVKNLSESAKVLVMAGKPLNQNVINYWPFVMTTPEEIMQAFKDLNAGKMGKVE